MPSPEKLARIFKVMSVDTRVKILQLLKKKHLCVNALAHSLEITPAAVSQHMRVLRDTDIVISNKRGYFVHYGINDKTMAEWRELTSSLLETEK